MEIFRGKPATEENRHQRTVDALRFLRKSLALLTSAGSSTGLGTFGGENRFWIRAGNFAHSDPTDPTNKRAEQKRNRSERNEREKPQNERERTVQHFADSNQPP